MPRHRPEDGVILSGIDFVPETQAFQVRAHVSENVGLGDRAQKNRFLNILLFEILDDLAELAKSHPV